MGLDAELCRKAQELYRWEVQFSGEVLYNSGNRMVEVSKWIQERARPVLGLGCELLGTGFTYGLVDLDKKNVFLCQPFATVYAGRKQDYQEDLLRAALLHLRRDISEKHAQVTFPAALQRFVRSHHLYLLEPDCQEIKRCIGEVAHIYRQGDPRDLADVLKHSRITDRSLN